MLMMLRPMRVIAQQRFHRQLPAGNYSGICPLGNDLYAVVSDKENEDGFFVFRMKFDSEKGRITEAENLGYRSSGLPNRDMEGVCYVPSTNTVFISGENDNEVYEYTLDGKRTDRCLAMPPEYKTAQPNLGLEALTYDSTAHLFYTTTERPLPGEELLRIQTFDDDLQPQRQYLYKPDEQISRKYYHGVSELLATGDGRLLVLERQMRIPRLKLGAKCIVSIYEVTPADSTMLEKRLVTSFKTRLTLTGRKFANYEGMCQPIPGWLLLIADSQGQYRGVIRDWFTMIKIE